MYQRAIGYDSRLHAGYRIHPPDTTLRSFMYSTRDKERNPSPFCSYPKLPLGMET